MRIVPALDEVEDRKRCFALRIESVLYEKLALESSVKALAHCIIVAVADGTHGHRDAGLTASFSKSDRRVLRSVIGMMDDGFRSSPINRHVERIDNEFFAHVVCHRPADDTPRTNVEHDSEKEKAGVRRHVRDIGNPKLVGKRCCEVAFYEITGNCRIPIARRCRDPLAPRGPVAMAFAHQAGHAFVASTNAIIFQLGLNSRTPVRRTRLPMDRFDPIAERKICESSRRWLSLQPSIVATLRDVVKSAERRNAVIGLVSLHESEDFRGIVSASRANQAAAFENFSCSKVNHLTSRRRRVSS